jgi:MinD-like ATPase involved in chromosome partitioning or flagellar assembly
VRPIKAVTVFSLDGGVGKTTIACTLAVAKGFTMIIDADWEKADISQLFRAPRKPGWLAPFINGSRPYVHRVNPMLYVVPGYDAAEFYQQHGEDVAGEYHQALLEWIEALPRFVASLRIPVDTVIIDTPAAVRLDALSKLQSAGSFNLFVADRRLLSRISDVKAEQYRRYMTYAALAAVNMLDRDELKIARKIAPVALKRVRMGEYYGETVAGAILRDRDNRRAIDVILARVKTA